MMVFAKRLRRYETQGAFGKLLHIRAPTPLDHQLYQPRQAFFDKTWTFPDPQPVD